MGTLSPKDTVLRERKVYDLNVIRLIIILRMKHPNKEPDGCKIRLLGGYVLH